MLKSLKLYWHFCQFRDIADANVWTNEVKLIHQRLSFSTFNNITARRFSPVIVVLRFLNRSNVVHAEIIGVMQTIWWVRLKLLGEMTIKVPKVPSCETPLASRRSGLREDYTIPSRLMCLRERCKLPLEQRTVVSSTSEIRGGAPEAYGLFTFQTLYCA